MKNLLVSLCSLIILYSCDCSYYKFSIKRENYNGNEIKMDGYFYTDNSGKSSTTSIQFFYRNGVVLSGGRYSLHNLDSIESEIINGALFDMDNKRSWSPFKIKNDTLITEYLYENPPSCQLLTAKSFFEIKNDTTIILKRVSQAAYKDQEYNQIWHFKQFFPKPDSTNIFIE